MTNAERDISSAGGFIIERIWGNIESTRTINATTWKVRIGFLENRVRSQNTKVAIKVPIIVSIVTDIPRRGENFEGIPNKVLAKYNTTRLANTETEIAPKPITKVCFVENCDFVSIDIVFTFILDLLAIDQVVLIN